MYRVNKGIYKVYLSVHSKTLIKVEIYSKALVAKRLGTLNQGEATSFKNVVLVLSLTRSLVRNKSCVVKGNVVNGRCC